MEVTETGDAVLTETRICATPIAARGRILGALTLLAGKNGRPYGPDDLSFAERLALLAGLAVDNMRLHQQVRGARDAAHVLTYVADGVFLVDRGGVVRLWNPTMEAITGFDAGRVDRRPGRGDVIPDWSTLVERIPVGRRRASAAGDRSPRDGTRRALGLRSPGSSSSTGRCSHSEISPRRVGSSELKAEFVATASHELRTPLAAVYGAAQTLRRHDFALDESGRERFVSLIVDGVRAVGADRQRHPARKPARHRATSSCAASSSTPGDLVERVVEAARAHGTLVDHDRGGRAGPPAPAIPSDRDRVRQVLVNLVENAIKYSPEGGRVEVGAIAVDKMVRFFVRDEGLGIPEEEQSRIFDKFYRLDPHMTAGVGGTGLGLYICNELVRRMGGRIWVEANNGQGSTFSFVIPAGESSAPRPHLHEVFESPGG